MPDAQTTHLLVDGENIDATLGNTILGRRPASDERPRWDAVRNFVAAHWEAEPNALFFLNASSGSLPLSFVQALVAMRYRVIPLSGGPGEKVVDLAILKTLSALAERPGNVLLASHDGDFAEPLNALLDDERRIGVIGFREFMSGAFRTDDRVELLDIEEDAHAFTVPLPRLRIIPIAEFDPLKYV